MPRAIITGASSGIGRSLALELADRGWELGLCARRLPLLEELAAELPTRSWPRRMDQSSPEEALEIWHELLREMGEVDLVILNAGVGFNDSEIPWEKERETIAVNVLGFTALAAASFKYFQERGGGHLVGVSSIAGLRGGPAAAYGASKAYMSTYLDGLRYIAARQGLPIHITDLRPGFVDTAMGQSERAFWSAPPAKAARQICDAIARRRKRVYVTKRWLLVAWLMRLVPDWIYHRL